MTFWVFFAERVSEPADVLLSLSFKNKSQPGRELDSCERIFTIYLSHYFEGSKHTQTHQFLWTLVLFENLNLFATDTQLCYLLSRYDDRCFFSPIVFPLFFPGVPLLSESPLPTLCSFSFSCDFYARSYCECGLWYLFPWHPNGLGNFINTSINNTPVSVSAVVTNKKSPR